MNVDVKTQAVLLLTAWFSKPTTADSKPLTPKEWGRFARWLNEHGSSPESLISDGNIAGQLQGWSDPKITPNRIERLLERGGALGIALEKWQRTGLWVMIRSDPDYPRRLKKQLKHDAPPILFGCGNRRVLDSHCIAVVGSRDASSADLAFTDKLGRAIASAGLSVVSGGARGVDEAAMLGALRVEGTVIGVLADSLSRAATSAKYREGLTNGNLVLISPFNPDARFEVSNAMGRNKYIYCLSDAAVVIATGKDRGGTWTGAVENLKHGWSRLWVKPHADSESGSAALVARGADWLPGEPIEVMRLTAMDSSEAHASADLIERVGEQESLLDTGLDHYSYDEVSTSEAEDVQSAGSSHLPTQGSEAPLISMSLYDLFLVKLDEATQTDPKTVEELEKHTGLGKAQLNVWLKQAVTEGKVDKLIRPVRYQAAAKTQMDWVKPSDS